MNKWMKEDKLSLFSHHLDLLFIKHTKLTNYYDLPKKKHIFLLLSVNLF